MTGRNDTLTSVAGRLRNQGLDHDDILAHLLACPERLELPDAEVRSIARSAMNWPAPHPGPTRGSANFPDELHELAARRGWSVDALRALGCTGAGGEVTFPMLDAAGREVGRKRRRADGSAFMNGAKSLSIKGCKAGLFYSTKGPLSDPILVVEGEADTAAALSAGCSSVVGTAGASVGRHALGWLQTRLSRRSVVLAPDPDDAGVAWRDKVGRALSNARCEVRFIPSTEGDLDRRLAAETNKREALADLIQRAVPWVGARGNGNMGGMIERVKIELESYEMRVNEAVLKALSERDTSLYQRGGALVMILQEPPKMEAIERPAGAPWIRAVPEAQLRERISAVVEFQTRRKNPETGIVELRPVHPPSWTVKATSCRGEYEGIRSLEAVVEVPVLRPDGTVLDQSGYDPATGLYLAPNCEYPAIAEFPTPTEGRAAADALLRVVEDFPFAKAAHRAAWLACALTPFARHAFRGPVPLALIDASVRGCGKTLLAELVGVLYSGRSLARMTYPQDEEELRKRITSLVMAGDPIVLMDNVVGSFGCGALDAALTGEVWRDRLLGTNQNVQFPLRMCLLATGNNVALAADTARRTLHVRLESPMERPEERADFKQRDLVGYVRRERPKLVAAALTVLRGYCAAKRPDMGLKPWGSFEEWSALVRSAVVWAGQPDPGATRLELAQTADREAQALRVLMENWQLVDPRSEGITVARLLDVIERNPGTCAPIRDALAELCPKLAPRSVGMKFYHQRQRVLGGLMLDSRNGKSGAQWVVRPVPEGGTTGTRGTNSNHLHARAGARVFVRAESSPVSPSSPPHLVASSVCEELSADGQDQTRDSGKGA